MTSWPLLDPVAQNELLNELTAMVVGGQPPDWREVVIDYRHLGRQTDGAVGALDLAGVYQLWDPPAEVWAMLQRLREGMYRVGEGTWFSVRLTFLPPFRIAVEYNWEHRPSFPTWPEPAEFAVEQERFPRADGFMPDWFLASLPR